MATQRLAPAKVNLFLHVGPVGPDGYHPICSLMTFADIGDVVALDDSTEFSFAIEGPFAADLDPSSDNLVLRARDAMAAAFRPGPTPFSLTLHKRLPIASGIGGGSSDAAAAMRLIAARSGLDSDPDEKVLLRLAAGLGSDVPVCLVGKPRVGEGRGDQLSRAAAFADLPAVLVNPRRSSPTGPVYRAYDEAGAPGNAERPVFPADLSTVQATAAFLAGCRNDLEAPAVALQPAIRDVLADLRSRPQTLVGRMSGSGATCFAICEDDARRDALARSVAAAHAGWWVQPCTLAGYSG